MQINTKEQYLNITEFAKMVDISRQTLIYYDKEGILKPVYKEDNGYRYYTYWQIDLVVTIQALKTIGLSLNEIKKYTQMRNSTSTYHLLNEQLITLEHQQNQLNQTITMIKSKCKVIEQAQNIFTNIVYLEYHQASHIYKSQEIPLDASISRQYQILSEHLRFRKEKRFNVGREVGGISRWKRSLVDQTERTEYAYYYTILDDFDPNTYPEDETLVSAGTYLVFYYQGPYTKTYTSYKEIADYAKKHNLQLEDYAFEESLIDEVTESNPNNYITQIMIRVKDINSEN